MTANSKLGPGERIVNGRVYYSAGWLSPPMSSRLDRKENAVTIYQVRTRFDVEPEEGDDLGPDFVVNLVAHALRQAVAADPALKPTQGITIHVEPRGAKVRVQDQAPA